MDNNKFIAVTLGALLFDGIIPAELKIIEKVIFSLNRAVRHISPPPVPAAVDDVQKFSGNLDQSPPDPAS